MLRRFSQQRDPLMHAEARGCVIPRGVQRVIVLATNRADSLGCNTSVDSSYADPHLLHASTQNSTKEQ